jgi:hypothetical protein
VINAEEFKRRYETKPGDRKITLNQETVVNASTRAGRWRIYAMLSLAALLVAVCFCLFREPSSPGSGISLASVSDTTNSSPAKVTFRLSNGSSRAIFLSWMVVEVMTESGWKEAQKVQPASPRVVSAGESTKFAVAVPTPAGPWRLRMIYGTQTRGPVLFFTKIELAIKNSRLSGLDSIGVFTGHKEVVAEAPP